MDVPVPFGRALAQSQAVFAASVCAAAAAGDGFA